MQWSLNYRFGRHHLSHPAVLTVFFGTPLRDLETFLGASNLFVLETILEILPQKEKLGQLRAL